MSPFAFALSKVPTDRKPTVPEVLPVVWAYRDKPNNSVGGSLHIVLEDDNVETGHVQWCRQYAEQQGDSDGVALADVLLRMSITQRLKLADRFHEGSKLMSW
jgi:hypothetical protein